MKTILHISVLALLLVVAVSPCLAMMEIELVSKSRAKELGMEIRSKPAGPDAAWIELEFPATGVLKDFNRVDLDIREPGKFLLSAPLKEGTPKPGYIAVSFTTDRALLDKITLTLVAGTPMNYTGYELRVKDFVELEKVR